MSDSNADKKRITVVTGFRGGNYGTKLQSTALCKYFEKLGYHVSILEKFTYKEYFFRHPDIAIARILKRTLLRNDTKRFFDDKEHYYYSKEREKKLEIYDRENYNPVTIATKDQFNHMIREKTTYVVGSDIIWQPAMGVPGFWFLDFIYYTNLNRFSYATSIGANELPKEYHYFYKKYLKKFKVIGVREKTAVKLLEPIIKKDVVQVIDPTLLHDTFFWDQYANKSDLLNEGIAPYQYVFCYFVMHDPRYWEYIKLVSNYLKKNPATKDYKIVVLPMHKIDETQPYTIIMNGTPYEFVYLIKNAAFIVTDSFHVCAFSLNYKKEFYLLRRARKDEDSKYDDFFLRYGLEDRSVENESVFIRKPNIDYLSAHERLKKDRCFADEFIKKAVLE